MPFIGIAWQRPRAPQDERELVCSRDAPMRAMFKRCAVTCRRLGSRIGRSHADDSAVGEVALLEHVTSGELTSPSPPGEKTTARQEALRPKAGPTVQSGS